jgi:hypothetical protein
MSETGKQKNKQSSLKYYYANREERIAYQKEYQQRKKKSYNKYQKEYYQKNKESLNPQRHFYVQAKRDAIRETKVLPQYKLNEIERVLKKKLKQIRKAEKLFYSDPEYSDTQNSASKTYDKYYQKKLLKKYQHSLPEPKPFSDFIETPNGFVLKF